MASSETTVILGNRLIGRKSHPFIVAEMSGNHNQSLERALAIVEAAAEAGAHGLKIQTYTADTMTLDLNDGDFFISDPDNPWKENSLYDLYRKAHTPWEWHRPIMDRARELGLIAFSTPFDETAVDFLEELEVPCYKIASFENTDIPLIRKVAATGKPMIVSTGMATVAELDETVRAARAAGCRALVLLKCTSAYPAPPADSHLRGLPMMRELFDCEVGLSDHTPGVGAAVAAVALGATIIEKHFTLDRADGGVDSAFSLEPAELAALVAETERAWRALGEARIGPTAAEQASLKYRRSLYAVRAIAAGEPFTPDNVRAIRPGHGLPPRELERVLARVARRAIARGEPLSFELLA